MEIKTQTKAQFRILHGEVEKQSRTAKACFDIIFDNAYRGVAAKKYGITEQTISSFIRNNEYRHTEMYRYIWIGEVTTDIEVTPDIEAEVETGTNDEHGIGW